MIFKSREQQKQDLLAGTVAFPLKLCGLTWPPLLYSSRDSSSVLCMGEEGVMVHKFTHSEREAVSFTHMKVILSSANYRRLIRNKQTCICSLEQILNRMLTISHNICAGWQQLLLVWFTPHSFSNQVSFLDENSSFISIFHLRGWWGTGTGCPVWWMLHPWQSSRPGSALADRVCCQASLPTAGGWNLMILRFFPTQIILSFYDFHTCLEKTYSFSTR